MLLVSQNAGNYDIKLPDDAVFRINLAWCNSIDELEEKLSSNKESDFFIDLPVGRIKPPNNRYTFGSMKRQEIRCKEKRKLYGALGLVLLDKSWIKLTN